MHVVVLAWAYVAVLMAVVEATSTNGTVLGAVFTFLLYGALPITIVMYLGGAPLRNRARRLDAARAAASESADAPDGSGHPAGDAVPPERKEP